MCFVVAKDRYAHGCYAYETRHGRHLVELKRKLNDAVGLKGVGIMTISRPEAYMEYAPYQIIEDEKEFIRLVKSMRDTQEDGVEAEKALLCLIHELELGLQSGKREGWIPSEDVRKHFRKRTETCSDGKFI